MTSSVEFDFNESPLSEAVIGATCAIRDDFSAPSVQQQLSKLVEEARDYISSATDADLRLEKLLELFYREWGFGGASGVYNLSDALWIDKVLKSRDRKSVV